MKVVMPSWLSGGNGFIDLGTGLTSFGRRWDEFEVLCVGLVHCCVSGAWGGFVSVLSERRMLEAAGFCG